MNLNTTLTACPFCQSTELEHKKHGKVMGSICGACGLVFLNPRMDDEQLARYYSTGQYRDSVTPNDTGISQFDLTRQQQRARWQWKSTQRAILHAGTCLEIGCSAGYMLEQLRVHEDMECVGIEADERYHAIAPARNFPLYTDISHLHPRKFDLVVMSHVLEHFNHPIEFLAMLRAKYMHKNSSILIEVPNYVAFPSTLSVNHAYAFEEHTLRDCLKLAGFGECVFFDKHGLGDRREFYLLGVWRA